MPSLPPIDTILPQGNKVVGTPTEVYTRIARGVLTCWFGAAGPLKATHIYHADAEPASKGGQAKIEIFERDAAAQDPRALRAYQVAIFPQDGVTKLEIENVKIRDPLASRFNADVERWAADEGGCGEDPVTGGWTAESAPPAAETRREKQQAKSNKR
jgi:hypothetical protein